MEEESLEVLVAIHGLDHSKEIGPKARREITRTLKNMKNVAPSKGAQMPIILVRPDGKFNLISTEGHYKHAPSPYDAGQIFDTVEEALEAQKKVANYMNGKSNTGYPTILVPDLQRSVLKEYDNLDSIVNLTGMYHMPWAGSRPSALINKLNKKMEDASIVYDNLINIYQSIISTLQKSKKGLRNQAQDYGIAIEKAVQEGNFGETFLRGIRAMSLDLIRALNQNSEYLESEDGTVSRPRDYLCMLREELQQRLERTRLGTKIGQTLTDGLLNLATTFKRYKSLGVERINKEYCDKMLKL